MRKRVTRIGNSFGILLERPIMELLNINANTVLEMRLEDGRLIIELPKARRHK